MNYKATFFDAKEVNSRMRFLLHMLTITNVANGGCNFKYSSRYGNKPFFDPVLTAVRAKRGFKSNLWISATELKFNSKELKLHDHAVAVPSLLSVKNGDSWTKQPEVFYNADQVDGFGYQDSLASFSDVNRVNSYLRNICHSLFYKIAFGAKPKLTTKIIILDELAKDDVIYQNMTLLRALVYIHSLDHKITSDREMVIELATRLIAESMSMYYHMDLPTVLIDRWSSIKDVNQFEKAIEEANKIIPAFSGFKLEEPVFEYDHEEILQADSENLISAETAPIADLNPDNPAPYVSTQQVVVPPSQTFLGTLSTLTSYLVG